MFIFLSTFRDLFDYNFKNFGGTMRILFLSILLCLHAYAASVTVSYWKHGETFLTFLEKNKLPLKTYYNLDREDQKLTEEIYAGTRYEMLKDKNGTILQVLIPINEKLQLHIYKGTKDYHFQVSPMTLDYKTRTLTFALKTSPYNDIMHYTHDRFLAQEFVWAFKNSLNFTRSLRKGDRVAVIYKQAYRSGQKFGYPTIQSALIEVHKKPHYIYLNTDGRYYNAQGKEVEGFMLARPIKNARITSPFTLRRYHPILKRYRAHLGVDFGACRGTPIHAAAKGRIISVARSRGYGNVIKIKHIDGYVTLYAHMKKFAKGMHRGKYVRKGQCIGYVGTTGLSTGPHLHFGLYKNRRAINPLGVLKVTTKRLKGKQRKAFQNVKNDYNSRLQAVIENNTPPEVTPISDTVCYLGARNPMTKYLKKGF